jgi:hypothetical protein
LPVQCASDEGPGDAAGAAAQRARLTEDFAANRAGNGPGSGEVKVVSFSWWILKDYANGGKVVDTVYVGPAATDPGFGNSLRPAYIP